MFMNYDDNMIISKISILKNDFKEECCMTHYSANCISALLISAFRY